MKKYAYKIISVCIILIILLSSSAGAIGGKAYAVLEADSGRLLYSNNMNERLPMASTTKLVTAIVAIENGNLNDIVKTSKNAYGTEGSSLYLQLGEELTLKQMLYGLMLVSGNDAAVAIAEHVGGSVGGFIKMMNALAKKLGAKNTNFANPNGLPNNNHYTTAYDLALIASYAMKNPTFREIVSTKYMKIPYAGRTYDRVLANKNKILWKVEGGNGIKTGFTSAAGRCLASAALRDNMQVVCIVLNCGAMFEDSAEILEKAFKDYAMETIINTKTDYGKVKVLQSRTENIGLKAEKELYLPIRIDGSDKVSIKYNVPESVKAPVKKGDKIGSVTVSIGGFGQWEINLVSDSDAKENTYKSNLDNLIKKFLWRN